MTHLGSIIKNYTPRHSVCKWHIWQMVTNDTSWHSVRKWHIWQMVTSWHTGHKLQISHTSDEGHTLYRFSPQIYLITMSKTKHFGTMCHEWHILSKQSLMSHFGIMVTFQWSETINWWSFTRSFRTFLEYLSNIPTRGHTTPSPGTTEYPRKDKTSFRPMSLVKFDDLLQQLFALIRGEVGVLDIIDARTMFTRVVVTDIRLHRIWTKKCMSNKRTWKPVKKTNVKVSELVNQSVSPSVNISVTQPASQPANNLDPFETRSDTFPITTCYITNSAKPSKSITSIHNNSKFHKMYRNCTYFPDNMSLLSCKHSKYLDEEEPIAISPGQGQD